MTGVATAALLIASLAVAGGPSRGAALLVALAGIALIAFAIAGRSLLAVVAEEARRDPDAASERAQLASMIAHELKNPLMAIKGLATTGSRLYESMSDEERLEFFKLIDAECSRLQLIAEETSTALKIDAGRVTYDIRPESLARLVEEAVWGFPHGEHPVLVEADAELAVPCDRTRIMEVLGGLLDNAAKFSPPDAPIEVRAFRGPDGAAVVEVADRGPGIPPQERERVFEKFSRWRPAGYEETPGAGLGLFICRAHLKAHGGWIDIDGDTERGTILRFTLPIEGERG